MDTQTFAMIAEHIPKDIAQLTYAYFMPPKDLNNWPTTYDYAFYGVWEKTPETPRQVCYQNRVLEGACAGGHREMVLFALTNRADSVDKGMWEAARHGHIEIVHLMITRGARDWNMGLSGACRGGHLDIARLMISNGANEFERGLWSACREGHLAAAKLMIEHGAHGWSDGLRAACVGGKPELARLIVFHGGREHVNLGFRSACAAKTRGPDRTSVEGRSPLAERHCDYDGIFAYLIAIGASRCSCKRSLNDHLAGAASSKR
jgi:hypothetical protein